MSTTAAEPTADHRLALSSFMRSGSARDFTRDQLRNHCRWIARLIEERLKFTRDQTVVYIATRTKKSRGTVYMWLSEIKRPRGKESTKSESATYTAPWCVIDLLRYEEVVLRMENPPAPMIHILADAFAAERAARESISMWTLQNELKQARQIKAAAATSKSPVPAKVADGSKQPKAGKTARSPG